MQGLQRLQQLLQGGVVRQQPEGSWQVLGDLVQVGLHAPAHQRGTTHQQL